MLTARKEMGDVKVLHLPGRNGGLGISSQENSVVKEGIFFGRMLCNPILKQRKCSQTVCIFRVEEAATWVNF